MGRGDLTDQQWQQLELLLPAQSPKTGRPNKDHRIILNGILWVLRTGAPWRDLPERYGPWRTVASRFYRWRWDGQWDRLLKAVQRQANIQGKVNWELHYVDGTMVRAHQHAAGAREKAGRRGIRPQSGRFQHQSTLWLIAAILLGYSLQTRPRKAL
jgi:transposase